MFKAVPFRFKLNTTKAGKIVPKIDIMKFYDYDWFFFSDGGRW